MRLAMRLPLKQGSEGAANDIDPREQESAEVIDLASRNSFPAVTQRKNKSDWMGLVAGVAVVAVLGGVTFWGMNMSRADRELATENSQRAQTQPTNQPASTVPVAQPKPAKPTPAPSTQPTPVGSSVAPAPVYSRPVNASPAPGPNPYASPTIVFDSGGQAVAVLPPQAEGGPSPASIPRGADGSDFASRIGGVGGGPAQARPMTNPTTTVTQGTLIPAVLETAINTDVPGYVRAVVSQDVRSFDGKRTLIPRSSRLIGQYQSGLQGGQKRAYVIWTRVVRPDGASVDLASPAVSFDGTAGLPGKVNTHFFQRFGSAMLLSVIGGLSAVSTGGASVVLGGGQSAAATALQQNGQISPTVRVRQGEPIRVFTARDLDFSQVS